MACSSYGRPRPPARLDFEAVSVLSPASCPRTRVFTLNGCDWWFLPFWTSAFAEAQSLGGHSPAVLGEVLGPPWAWPCPCHRAVWPGPASVTRNHRRRGERPLPPTAAFGLSSWTEKGQLTALCPPEGPQGPAVWLRLARATVVGGHFRPAAGPHKSPVARPPPRAGS